MSTTGPDLKTIFSEALELAAGPERSAYLDRACGADASLRLQVESLLKAHDEAGDFLRSSARPRGEAPVAAELPMDPAVAVPETAVDREPATEAASAMSVSLGAARARDETLGARIGPYKLLQKIGEGGMGAVFMAEQERPVRRKVALKVIKPGMDTGQVIARFEAERQALAMMDHPNIAKVLDAGATDAGRPFFVMELVRGVPITEYCDRNQLTPKERLELFIPVCQAIQHAHQKGVIHRDIKPSNVLVTLHDGKPVPKVIDFGVAKAVDQRLTEKTMFTEFGVAIGTLEYMSPEQAEMGALDIDTRSDVYSLGVMLYELLTGSTPLERVKLRKAAYAEIVRRIREEEPTKPSTRLSESKDALPSISAQRKMEPARLTKLVRGELDWIVMKSLEKDRTRRYETANGFARDIQRYLDGDAVEASPPSATYRLRKFARRHRAVLATVGVIAFLLIVATAVSLALAARAVRAETSAKAQQGRAQDREQMAIDAVKRYGDMVRDTPELKNDPGLARLRTALLKEPQAFFKSLRDRLQADRETTPASLARLAAASFALGYLTDEIGDKQDALRAFEESLAIRERLARDNPSVTQFQHDLAGSLTNIGGLQHETGRTDEALASLEQARAIRERLARDNPSVAQFQSEMAASHNNIGVLQSDTGRPAEALASYDRARAIRERLARDNPSVAQFQSSLAGSHFNIGALQLETGRPAEALTSFERAREIFERLARENPSVIEFQSGLAKCHNNIGNLQRETGRPAEALASYEQGRVLLERLARDSPSVIEFQRELANSHNSIGGLQHETGRTDEALASYEQARAISERLVRVNPSVTQFHRDLAQTHHNIAKLQYETGRPIEAQASNEQARAIRERLARENPTVTQFQRELANSHNNIGGLQHETGRPADALASYEQARAIQERLARENPSVIQLQTDLAGSHINIGALQRETGRPAEALASFEQARAIWERLARENHSVTQFQSGVAMSQSNIGVLQREVGRPADALASLEQARAIFERLVRENPSVIQFQSGLAKCHSNIGVLKGQTGRPAEALASYEQTRAILERLAREHPQSPDYASDLGGTLNNMAEIDLDQRHFDEARTKLTRAVEWQRKALAANPHHPTYRQFLANHLNSLVRAAEGLGRADEADKARRELAKLHDSDPQIVALDARLDAVLKGQTPNDGAERVQLALRAYEKSLHATAARLFAEALANDPKLAADRQTQHAYNAACAAALAAAGKGKDDPPPDEAARAKLRRQARQWLQAELAAWAKLLDAGPAELKVVIAPTLKHWKVDADLAGIRDEKELGKLPDEERAALQKLWADVDGLLTRAAGAK